LPLIVGATHDTTAAASSSVALTNVGAPGGPIGVTGLEGCEVAAPPPFVAVTVKEYVVPLRNPITVAREDLPPTTAVAGPGEAVTM
jgi:hypothetical protein